MRYPSVTITSLVAQLISYPVGCFLAKALPVMTFRVFGRWDLVINPDHHFNVKEHAVVTIMSNLSFGQSWVSFAVSAGFMFADTVTGQCHHSSTKGVSQDGNSSRISNPIVFDDANVRTGTCRVGLQVHCGATSNGKTR